MPLPWISVAPQTVPVADLSTAGTLLGRWNISSVAGSDGTKFTSWADTSGSAQTSFNTMDQAANGGLTYRSSVAAFGSIAAAEAAATTDGLYIQSGFFNQGISIARPFTWVVFGKLGASPVNNDYVAGNSNYSPLSKIAGSIFAQGPGGNGMAWSTAGTTVSVWTVLYNTTVSTSRKYLNGTQDGADGNLNTTAFSGEMGVGHNTTQVTTAGSQVNEMAFFSGDVSGNLSSIIMPYFRSKSGLALL